MAARESQGMQIALIIFVILTVALGVSTYLFFDKYQQETLKDAGNQEKVKAAIAEKEAVEKELADVITVVTRNPKTTAAAIKAEYEQIHNDYYKPETEQEFLTYPEMVEQLKVAKSSYEGNYISARDQVLALEKKVQEIEIALKGQIAVFKTNIGTSAQRVADLDNKLKLTMTESHDRGASQLAILDTQKRKLRAHETLVAKQLGIKDEMIRTKAKRERELLSELEKRRPKLDAVAVADARVTRVDGQTAYLNLGSADGLQNRVRFMVIPNNDQAVGEAAPKATLEITRVLDEHRAMARILDSELLNPVLENDRVYSETWRKGQKTTYALAGWMDMDGDGRSDRKKIAAIIASKGGGRVQAQVHDDGRIEGEMTVATDYLITGDYPREPIGNKAAQRGFDGFEKTAKSNNTRKMNFRVFLNSLGITVVDSKGKTQSFRTRKPGAKKSAY